MVLGKPRVIVEKPQPVTVWYGLWFRGVIGPFSKMRLEQKLTVNGLLYRKIINQFL